MKPGQEIIWPSHGLRQFAEKQTGVVPALSNPQRQALKRLVSEDNYDLKAVYQKLTKKYGPELADRCFARAFCFYLDTEIFDPCRTESRNDWLRRLDRAAQKLATAVSTPPSGAVIVPPELSNAEALILAGLKDFGDEIAIAQFRNVDPYLKRALQKIPLTFLLDTLAGAARQACTIPPEHYWEKECKIRAPRKHGKDGAIAEQQILIRGIRNITRELFSVPHHETVATLVNTFLQTSLDADSVSKIPD